MTLRIPTTIAGYTKVFALVMEARGINYREVFDEARVEPANTTDPLRRISTSEVSRLFAVSVERTADPYLGIEIGKTFQPGQIHALGYGLLSSTTLRDFFNRIEKYYRVASENAEFISFDEGGLSLLSARNINVEACAEAIDVWSVFMVRLIRMAYQRPLNPVRVELSRPCPALGAQPYIDFFGCPVYFDHEATNIAFDSTIMDERLPAASEDLALHHDQIVSEYLEKLQHSDMSTRVRKKIVEQLLCSSPSKDAIARALNISTRTMHNRLASEGNSFQKVLEDCRKELAMSYMQQSHMAITEIAFLLGFADPSNFTRAFRRWTGKSPREYREER